MNNLLADIQKKKKKKLKKTTTKVTHRDGQVYEEKKSDKGNYISQYQQTIDVPDYLKNKLLTDDDIKKHDDYVQSFDIENWFNDLKLLTFETYFISISIQIAQKIIDLYVKKQSDDIIKEFIKNDSDLILIYKEIDKLILKHCMNNNINEGCFIKLSSRSPKDSTFNKLKEIFNKKIFSLKNQNQNQNISLNQCIDILFNSGFESMKCVAGIECLLNIIKSKRCYQDLVIALKYKNVFKQNIILRPWIDIASQNEFRAFIYDNKFVAMSQYNYTVKYDDIILNKDYILKYIINYWNNKCKDILSIKYDKYIIDFAVIVNNINDDIDIKDNDDDNDNNDNIQQQQQYNINKIYVIELNPFENDTDSLLFDWKSKKDYNILTGKSNFEFRIQQKEFDNSDMWRLLPSHKLLVENAVKT